MNFFVILIVWNIFVFAVYKVDKINAKRGYRRVSEATLLAIAFLMGAPGAAIGMRFCRHKTKKLKFRILMPIAFTINILAWVLIYYYVK